MRWSDLPTESRSIVLAALRKEASRCEAEAAHGEAAAQTLGRPSLIDAPLGALVAFQAALELLEGHPPA